MQRADGVHALVLMAALAKLCLTSRVGVGPKVLWQAASFTATQLRLCQRAAAALHWDKDRRRPDQ